MRKINKMCSFYVNDWHLTVMMLPYINGKLQENEKVTIISEENLLNNINIILERTNIKEEYKKQIQTIGWEKTSKKEIKNKIQEQENGNNIIIIGKEDYIENTNKIIENKVKQGEVNVIDCYEVMEFNNNMENILKNHEKIINTSGERSVEESFEGFNKKEAI